MKNFNINETTDLISYLIQSVSNRQEFEIDDLSVNNSINLVLNLQPFNEYEVFLKLCALNLLNAAIKTETFKDVLSYDLIKSNAAKLVSVIDRLKTCNITYFYNKEENCLYIKLASIVFSFHHVPLISEILKASFNQPISWPGIRLQKIAQPLLNHALKIGEENENVKAILEANNCNNEENNEIGYEMVNSLANDSNTNNIELLNSGVNLTSDKDCTTINKNDIEINQDNHDILNGFNPGDNIEINTYGILKSGKIIVLNDQFVQLELDGNKYIRIKREAISSIEYNIKINSIIPVDLSFANPIIKNVLISEGLYSSETIKTNATITMVESRRIWIATDDKNTGSCYKGSILGYDKEKLVKGQRIYAFPFKKEKVYCVIMGMSYYELYELFENLTLLVKDNISDHKRAQILNLLTFLIKNIKLTESLSKVKELKKQLKDIMPLSASSLDDILEEDLKNEEPEIELLHDTINIEDTSLADVKNDLSNNAKSSPEDNHTNASEIEIYKPESTLLQGPKIVGKIDLSEIWTPKNKKEEEVNDNLTVIPNDSISIYGTNDLLPSMGKIIKMGNTFGFVKPHNQENNLFFNTAELVSYAGIIDTPSVGDEVIYSLGKNAHGPIAVCVHKQCTREIIEELVDKFHYNAKTSGFLKKHIEDFNNLNLETSNDIEGLVYYLNKVGINPKNSFSINNVEKLFAEKLSSNEYVIAIEKLIDIVVKKDSSKCYNLFLRSSSYAKSQKMYDVSKHLIVKALEVFKGEEGKIKYFNGLLKTINTLSNRLSNRIEINERTLIESLEISKYTFSFMPIYVRDTILAYKDFNGITPDKDTIRTGLYKEDYIEELKDNIKLNNADDLLYLTMMKLQLAFHPKEYNPKDDISKFLVNRAKNILAIGDEHRYSDVRYLLRLAYRIKSFEKGFDDTVGLYLMTLGDYTASEIDMYMSGRQSDYKFDDLLKNILVNEVNNTLELTLLAESNVDIKNRIVKEFEKFGKNTDCFDEFPTIVNEVKKRYNQYAENPAINFMSFISYLQTTAILLDREINIVKNDFVKMVSHVTDFNTGQKYQVILDAYNNIMQKIDTITPNLSTHPTEIGYETILPALELLRNNIHQKFVEIEQRVNPIIIIDILDSVGLEDNNTIELKIVIRNAGDSARNVHINKLKVSGNDLIEDNNINIDFRLSAGDEKTINIELHLCDNALKEKIAEVEFDIDYDDIYIANNQRITKSNKIYKTIEFEIKSFVEIENRFRQGAGGEELESGDSMFYGRDVIISNIQQAILTGTKNQIAIYGQKRSGKSSLLNQIRGRLVSDELHSVICGKFSLQGLPDEELKPVRWILKSIAISLLRGIRDRGINKLNKSIISEFFSAESDDFTALREFIEYINTIEELHKSHFVIFIDEFTYLYQLIKDGRVNEDFMRRWIAFIETPGINLQAIVAAQDTLPHFMNESYASNYFNKFSKEPLSYLSKEEALRLIKNPIKEVKFHNHSEELIYEYTSGSAFFTQIFCTRLIDYLNSEKKTTVVGKDEIETVANRLCTGTDRLEPSTFECLTKEADGSNFNELDNKKVLKAIAENTRAGGYTKLDNLDVNLSREQLEKVVDNLYSRRVISKQNDGYSINVKLFVKWILNN